MNEYLNKGDRRQFAVAAVNSSGVPSWPSAAVTCKVYNTAGSLQQTIYLSPLDRFVQTGVLGDSVLTTANGTFLYVIQWTISGTTYQAVGSYVVRNVGDGKGIIKEMFDVLTPQGNGLLLQDDAGVVYFGRNPH